MKETDWRNTLEVIVKGLVAVVVALAGLYILGWVLSFLGGLLLGLAGIIVALLRWLVPIALIVGFVYFAVTQLQPKPQLAKAEAVKTEPAAQAKSEDSPPANIDTAAEPESVSEVKAESETADQSVAKKDSQDLS
jgi:uncharacterized membrane protein